LNNEAIMAKISEIVIHCSDSTWGNNIKIEAWHKMNGWSGIGYHEVILNGNIRAGIYNADFDGTVETGRPFDNDEFLNKDEIGAHAYGLNSKSIGICLIGKKKFTNNQIESLISRVRLYMKRYGISIEKVRGHYEHDPKKSCPNIDMVEFRGWLHYLAAFK